MVVRLDLKMASSVLLKWHYCLIINLAVCLASLECFINHAVNYPLIMVDSKGEIAN